MVQQVMSMVDARPEQEQTEGDPGYFSAPDAACPTHDPDMFFPGRRDDVSALRAICSSCPARIDCLEYALSNRVTAGFWGGATEAERRTMLRRRAVGAGHAGHPGRVGGGR